ncbi:relaxase/mobilization nuclease domain-containing protein [Peptoniphilaceae bacterium SGI.131]
MAYTKIKAIYETINKAINYITDFKKTSEDLIYSFKTTPKTAYRDFYYERKFANNKLKIKARHLIVSFEENEISSKKALEFLKKLCDRELKSEYQFVLSIHTDTNNIHGHIIFNPINLITGKAYISNKKSYNRIKNYVDELSKEYGLKIIEKKETKEKYINTKSKGSKNIRQKVKEDIDKAILKSSSFEEFLNNLKRMNYEVKRGKNIAIKNKYFQDRFIRLKDNKLMGEMYSEEIIRKRIIDKNYKVEFLPKKNLRLRAETNNFNKAVIDGTCNHIFGISAEEKEEIRENLGFIVNINKTLYYYRKWAKNNNILTIQNNFDIFYKNYNIRLNKFDILNSMKMIDTKLESLKNIKEKLIFKININNSGNFFRKINLKKINQIDRSIVEIEAIKSNINKMKQYQQYFK